MGFCQSFLPLSTALIALSLIGLNAQELPETHLRVDQGCVGYHDHFLDATSWACAGEGLGGKITPDADGTYLITVFTLWYTNMKNPPMFSKPLRQQTFQWNGYKGDVLVTQYGCLRTVAASGQHYERIGECPAGTYLGKIKLLDPYWQKQDFLQRNPQFNTPADANASAKQVSVPEISSPEISFSGQTSSTFETGQTSNPPLANGASEIADPLALANGLPTTMSPFLTANELVPELSQPVADFSSLDGRPSGQVYTSSNGFVTKRSRKQQRQRRV